MALSVRDGCTAQYEFALGSDVSDFASAPLEYFLY